MACTSFPRMAYSRAVHGSSEHISESWHQSGSGRPYSGCRAVHAVCISAQPCAMQPVLSNLWCKLWRSWSLVGHRDVSGRFFMNIGLDRQLHVNGTRARADEVQDGLLNYGFITRTPRQAATLPTICCTNSCYNQLHCGLLHSCMLNSLPRPPISERSELASDL